MHAVRKTSWLVLRRKTEWQQIEIQVDSKLKCQTYFDRTQVKTKKKYNFVALLECFTFITCNLAIKVILVLKHLGRLL